MEAGAGVVEADCAARRAHFQGVGGQPPRIPPRVQRLRAAEGEGPGLPEPLGQHRPRLLQAGLGGEAGLGVLDPVDGPRRHPPGLQGEVEADHREDDQEPESPDEGEAALPRPALPHRPPHGTARTG